MPAPGTDRGALQQIIRALRASGHTLDSVDDGEDNIVVTTETAAIEVIEGTGVAHLCVKLPDGDTGWVFFVLGNDPDEVINDHTTNLSPTLDALMGSWS